MSFLNTYKVIFIVIAWRQTGWWSINSRYNSPASPQYVWRLTPVSLFILVKVLELAGLIRSAQYKVIPGNAIAQALSRWIYTATARVWAQLRSCAFCFVSQLLLHSHRPLSSGNAAIGQIVAELPSILSQPKAKNKPRGLNRRAKYNDGTTSAYRRS
jgi:hypothetical protein